MKIKIFKGDITKIKADAIVNAANTSLLGGGGVDGALHKVAGEKLLEACKKVREKQGKCKPGSAVITEAGNLPANFVIHTVGPVWNGGANQEKETLKQCYINIFKLAKEYQIKTISIPNISTGRYRYPKEAAAKIAITTAQECSQSIPFLNEVLFVCFDESNYSIYKNYLNH